jgi:hypothetical protein
MRVNIPPRNRGLNANGRAKFPERCNVRLYPNAFPRGPAVAEMLAWLAYFDHSGLKSLLGKGDVPAR